MNTDFETLVDFVGRQVVRGKLSPNTAQSYLSSLNRTFEVATDVERANVLAVDLEALFQRFRGANSALQDNTGASYEGRVRAAIKSFGDFVEKEADGVPMTMGTLSIPLRAGVVRIDGLPSDLTPVEANRIAAMIVAMAN